MRLVCCNERAEELSCNDCHRFTAALYAANYSALTTTSSLSDKPRYQGRERRVHQGPRDDNNLHYERDDRQRLQHDESLCAPPLTAADRAVCKKCGSLIFRRGENPALKGWSIMRCGGLDDVKLRDTVFKPTIEQYNKYREAWLPPLAGLEQHDAMPA